MESKPVVGQMVVEHDVFIEADVERVWQVVTSVDGIKAWLGPREYEPRVGAKVEFHTTHEGRQYIMSGEVVAFDAPRVLAFTWNEQPVGGEPWPAATLVTITLTPENGGTRLTLQHSGFENLPKEIAQQEYEGYVRGWAHLHGLDDLKALVEAG